ncbi:MAG: hypothetical protein ACFFCS_11405 [Candidatus Hodarchaeota archaeon]
MPEGFFKTFLISLADDINNKFKEGDLICVRKVRRVLDIPSTDRSKIIFIARALQKLKKFGYLVYVGRHSPKKYKKAGTIPINKLKEMILNEK